MLTIVKEQVDGVLTVRLHGVLDEHADLRRAIEETSQSMVINCRGLVRINSTGARLWMRFFNEKRATQVKVIFQECPMAIIDRLNTISGFLCGGKLESVHLPFRCTHCSTELIQSKDVRILRVTRPRIPLAYCPKCRSSASFDDIPSRFFTFLDVLAAEEQLNQPIPAAAQL